MTIKDRLQEVHILETRIMDKMNELEKLRNVSTSISSPIIDEARGTSKGNDKIGDMVCSIVDLSEEIVRQIAELYRLKFTTMSMIERVDKQEYKRLLELRYIKCMKIEEIAVAMNYGYRHTKRQCKLALIECEKVNCINNLMKVEN